MTIDTKQQEVIDEFAVFDEWMDKYEYLIGLGHDLPLIEEGHKTDDNLIKGCQSRVWLHANYDNNQVHYYADSDAIITKGIIALMIRVLSGHSPDEITNAELYFIDRIGLKEHLSPTRSNGLVAMVKQMKWYALAFKAKTT